MELELPNDIELLKATVKKLLLEIEQLKAKNAELKAENAELRSRLDKNSGNSHKPPSTDSLTKKPALSKPRTSNNGGQKGHKGNTLRQVSEPDSIVCHYPEICSCCGKTFGPVNFPVIAYEFAANCNCSEALAASMGNQKCFHW